MKMLSGRLVFTTKNENGTKNENWLLDNGIGDREYKSRVSFEYPFNEVPTVQVSLAHLDILNTANARIGVDQKNVDKDGFDLVFQTWEDTQIAGLGIVWFAHGE